MNTASKFTTNRINTTPSTGCRKRRAAFTDCQSSKKLPPQWGLRAAHQSERTFYGPRPALLNECSVGIG